MIRCTSLFKLLQILSQSTAASGLSGTSEADRQVHFSTLLRRRLCPACIPSTVPVRAESTIIHSQPQVAFCGLQWMLLWFLETLEINCRSAAARELLADISQPASG